MLLIGRKLCSEVRVWGSYFKHREFFYADRLLKQLWLFSNPFRVCRKEREKAGYTLTYAYGETPLETMRYLADLAKISPSDTVFDLGCGRGRAVFFLSLVLGANAVGVDLVRHFINSAKEVKMRLCLSRVSFILADMLEVDLSLATVVYVYGTCLEDAEIEKLVDACKKCNSGCRFICVSFSLKESAPDFFEKQIETKVRFPWGYADVVIEERK